MLSIRSPLIVLASLSVLAFAAENCIREIKPGVFVDVSSLEGGWSVPFNEGAQTIFFTPCGTLEYTDVMPEGNPYCNDDSLACELQGTPPSASPSSLIGNLQNFLTWENSTTGEKVIVHITGGSYCPAFDTYRQLTVNILCDTTIGGPIFDFDDECHYVLKWLHPAGCAVTSGMPTSAPSSTPPAPTPTYGPVPSGVKTIVKAYYAFRFSQLVITDHHSMFINILTNSTSEVRNIHPNMQCMLREDAYYICEGDIPAGENDVVVSLSHVVSLSTTLRHAQGHLDLVVVADSLVLPTSSTYLPSYQDSLQTIAHSAGGGVSLIESSAGGLTARVEINGHTVEYLNIDHYMVSF